MAKLNPIVVIAGIGGLLLWSNSKANAKTLSLTPVSPGNNPLPVPPAPKPQPQPSQTTDTLDPSAMLDEMAQARKDAQAEAQAAKSSKDPVYMVAVADNLDEEYDNAVADISNDLRTYARNLPLTKVPAASQTTAPSPPNRGYPTLRKGSNGTDVERLRRLLNAHGYNVPISSNFDSSLDNAVRDYQKKNGLTVDGIVGPKTWDSLVTT